MSRTTRRRTVRAVAPVAGLLAAGLLVWQGSTAAFSASTVNTGDAWTTGNLVLNNNGGVGTTYTGTTAALITASNLGPSSTATRCITVDSDGSIAGSLKFYRGVVTDTNVANPLSNLSTKVNLAVNAAVLTAGQTVDSSCIASAGIVAFPGASTAVYTGTLNALPTTYAGTGMAVAAGTNERVAYRITWTIDPTTDNTFQSASTVANLVWEIQ